LNLKKVKNFVKRKVLFALVGMIAIVVVLSLALIKVRSVRSGPQVPTRTPTYALTPVDPELLPVMPTAIQPEIVDLAPDIPYEDKPSVVVQHPDGSRTRYLVAPDALDAFIEDLPEGDKFVGDIPPPSILGAPEPPTVTPGP
jgi:hypothetical protein